MNVNPLLLAYTIFLIIVMYIWNPTDAEGIARWFGAVLIIIVASILGAGRRLFLGIDLSEINEENE